MSGSGGSGGYAIPRDNAIGYVAAHILAAVNLWVGGLKLELQIFLSL